MVQLGSIVQVINQPFIQGTVTDMSCVNNFMPPGSPSNAIYIDGGDGYRNWWVACDNVIGILGSNFSGTSTAPIVNVNTDTYALGNEIGNALRPSNDRLEATMSEIQKAIVKLQPKEKPKKPPVEIPDLNDDDYLLL